MTTVVLVIHLLLAVALVAVILLQRSEGGALGIGGGSGGFLTARGTANLLTRTTAILAAAFMVTSLALAMLAGHARGPSTIFDSGPAPAPAEPNPAQPAPTAPSQPSAPVPN